MPRYRIDLDDLHGHQYRVTLRLARPAMGQELALPVWIPGSYLVREFARHLSGLEAEQGGRPCRVEALDKARWQVHCGGRGALTLSYRVYAFDRSVRGAWLDDRRGFFNGTSLLLRVPGREAEPHEISLGPLPAGWQVATTMPAAGPRRWRAADYDEAVDHPFELGPFWRGRFDAGGVPHELVVSGAWPRFDGTRLVADLQRVCDTVQAFWQVPGGQRTQGSGSSAGLDMASAAGPETGKGPIANGTAVPFARYAFLLNAQGDGHGGLEHRASTALAVPRRDLPVQGRLPSAEGYTSVLGLACHEYFHAWHVKRLKPAELARLDYQHENPTRLLWLFEGFTTYYEDLLLRRAGLVDAPRNLRLLAQVINGVAGQPGRRVQSVAAASFDAWTKLYRPDEHTLNATVSYYGKGALVALALDLTLRQRGRGASLDAVMRRLWQTRGAGEGAGVGAGLGAVTEADWRAAVRAVAGRALHDELDAWVHGTDDLPLEPLLASMGIHWQAERPGLAARLGLRLSEGPVTGVQVRSVLAGGAAAAAGVAAGDELLAVDGWRIRRLDEAEAWLAPDRPFTLLLVRDQQVVSLELAPTAAPGPVVLSLHDRPSAAVLKRRMGWIGA